MAEDAALTEDGLAARAAAAGLAAAGVGFLVRRQGKEGEGKVDELTERMAGERSKESLAAITAERKELDAVVGVKLSV